MAPQPQWLVIIHGPEIEISKFHDYAAALALFRTIEAGGDFHASLARQMMTTDREAAK